MTCRLTLAEYAALPNDDGWRDELSRGMRVREPQPGYGHARIASVVYDLLRGHEGVALMGAGFLLSSDPPTVRAPDVAFVLPTHVPCAPPRLWLERHTGSMGAGSCTLLSEGDVLTGAPVLPDLRVRVRNLFSI